MAFNEIKGNLGFGCMRLPMVDNQNFISQKNNKGAKLLKTNNSSVTSTPFLKYV